MHPAHDTPTPLVCCPCLLAATVDAAVNTAVAVAVSVATAGVNQDPSRNAGLPGLVWQKIVPAAGLLYAFLMHLLGSTMDKSTLDSTLSVKTLSNLSKRYAFLHL